MSRLMITGARGQLGRALCAQAEGRFTLWAGDAEELDICDREAVLRTIGEFAPDAVINAAAYTAVDKAESEPELARRINVDGPRHLAEACAAHGARLLHLSTDFVFDGQASTPYAPDAATRPLGVYGETKRDGEQAVMQALPQAGTIVRTAWVWGPGGHNFVRTMLRLLAEREELGVVMDQVGSPTCTPGLAAALLKLVEDDTGRGEIHHWTDAGVTSWYDFAVAIRELAAQTWPERNWGRVRPIYTADYPTPARRPAYSVLDCRSLQALVGPARHWRDALATQLADLGQG